MALTPEKIAALKASCKTVKKRPMKFFYCAAGQDGDPEILIGKNITNEVKALKKTAKKKKFVRGEVSRAGNKLQFVTEDPKANKFAKNLKTFFGAKIGDFKKALIKTPEEIEEEQEALEEERQAKLDAKAGGAPDPEEDESDEEPGGAEPEEDEEDKDPDFFELLGPEDSKRVNSLKAKFVEKGMDPANAEKAAKAAAVLKKDDSDDKSSEPNLAPFALDQATKQIGKVEQKVSELRDLRVDRAAEQDLVEAIAESTGIDAEIRQLNANARVYLALARKSAVGDPQSSAAGQGLASRLEELLGQRNAVIDELTESLAEVRAQLQARAEDAEGEDEGEDEGEGLEAAEDALAQPLSDVVDESEVQQIQGEELGYSAQDSGAIDPEDAEEDAEDEADESVDDEDEEEDEEEPEESLESLDEASDEYEEDSPEDSGEPDEDEEEGGAGQAAAAQAAKPAEKPAEKPAGAKQATPSMLQDRLKDLGFDCGESDGVVGKLTRGAVRAFQKSKGLQADGVVGPQTLAALGFAGKKLLPQPKPPPPMAAAAAAVAAAIGGVAGAVGAAAATVAGAVTVDQQNQIGPDDDESVIALKKAAQQRNAEAAAKKKAEAQDASADDAEEADDAAEDAAKKKAEAQDAAKKKVEAEAAAKKKAAEEAAAKKAAEEAAAKEKAKAEEEDDEEEQQAPSKPEPKEERVAQGPPGYERLGDSNTFQNPTSGILFHSGVYHSPDETFRHADEKEVKKYLEWSQK